MTSHREQSAAYTEEVLQSRGGLDWESFARCLARQIGWSRDKLERGERVCNDPWDQAHLRTMAAALAPDHPLLKRFQNEMDASGKTDHRAVRGMTPREFDEFRTQFNLDCEKVLLTKGHDYAGEGDRHRNFKQAAEAAGVSPLVCWAIFMKKHWDSIMTYVREGGVQSEPIMERFKDLRNYVDLGAGLVHWLEQQKAPAPELGQLLAEVAVDAYKSRNASLGGRTEARLGDAR
jgi:hypothetical protein